MDYYKKYIKYKIKYNNLKLKAGSEPLIMIDSVNGLSYNTNYIPSAIKSDAQKVQDYVNINNMYYTLEILIITFIFTIFGHREILENWSRILFKKPNPKDFDEVKRRLRKYRIRPPQNISLDQFVNNETNRDFVNRKLLDIIVSHAIEKKLDFHLEKNSKFVRTGNPDTLKLDKQVRYANANARGNYTIPDSKLTHVSIYTTKQDLRLVDLTTYCFIFGLQLKAGQNNRGLFDACCQIRDMIYICKKHKINGFVMFDSVDGVNYNLFRNIFNLERNTGFRSKYSERNFNEKLIKDVKELRAVPITHYNAMERNITHVVYPEFIFCHDKMLNQLFEKSKNIRIDRFYSNPNNFNRNYYDYKFPFNSYFGPKFSHNSEENFNIYLNSLGMRKKLKKTQKYIIVPELFYNMAIYPQIPYINSKNINFDILKDIITYLFSELLKETLFISQYNDINSIIDKLKEFQDLLNTGKLQIKLTTRQYREFIINKQKTIKNIKLILERTSTYVKMENSERYNITKRRKVWQKGKTGIKKIIDEIFYPTRRLNVINIKDKLSSIYKKIISTNEEIYSYKQRCYSLYNYIINKYEELIPKLTGLEKIISHHHYFGFDENSQLHNWLVDPFGLDEKRQYQEEEADPFGFDEKRQYQEEEADPFGFDK